MRVSERERERGVCPYNRFIQCRLDLDCFAFSLIFASASASALMQHSISNI